MVELRPSDWKDLGSIPRAADFLISCRCGVREKPAVKSAAMSDLRLVRGGLLGYATLHYVLRGLFFVQKLKKSIEFFSSNFWQFFLSM